MSVQDRPVDTFRLVLPELLLQRVLRPGVPCEHDEAGRVAVDSVDHERARLPARPQVVQNPIVRGGRPATPLERDREQTSRLVQHHQRLVFEDDGEIAARERAGAPPGAARPVHPDADEVAGGQVGGGVGWRRFGAVEEHLAALERSDGAAARSQPIRSPKELVEPRTRAVRADCPVRVRHLSAPTTGFATSGGG